MVPIVVDTNVFAVVDGMHPAASENCVAACTDVLLRVHDGHSLVVDSSDEILTEYIRTLRSANRSGLASKLARRLYHTRHGFSNCHAVDISPTTEPPGSYVEVPTALQDFDTDDQKFIALAAAYGGAVPIVAGVDGEWWDRQADFTASGMNVQFPCMAYLMI